MFDKVQDWRSEREAEAQAEEMIAMMGLGSKPDFHQQIDTIRTFINDHSIHKIDEAFWANHGSKTAYAAGVIAHAKNPVGEPVHMECSTRSILMARLLHRLGYKTRIIAIYRTTRRETHVSFVP